MSQLPHPPVKTRQLMERYQKLRRRQFTAIAGIAAVACAAAGLILLLWLLISTHFAAQHPAGTGRPRTHRTAPRLAKVARVLDLQPAPQLIALDDAQLYAGTNLAPHREASELRIDKLEAYGLDTGKQAWALEQEQEASWIGASAGMVLCLRQYLVAPPSIHVKAFDNRDGVEKWTWTQDRADQCQARLDANVLVLGYREGDQYRIAGLDPATGAKLWAVTPEGGLGAQQDLATPEISLQLALADAAITYRLGNHAGLISAADGKQLREITAKGYVYEVDYDSTSQTVYVLSQEAANTYALQALPVGGGAALDLHRFTAAASDPLLVAEQGYASLAYSAVPQGAATPQPELWCFAPGSAQPLAAYRFDEGAIWEIAPLPALPGEFIVAVNESTGKDGKPSGWAQLYRVRATDQSLWKLRDLDKPVLFCCPFKEDVIVAVQGGEVLSLRSSRNKLSRLVQAKYPDLDVYSSASADTLALASYDDAQAGSQEGPVQAIVLK
jgi:hypothetical protein